MKLLVVFSIFGVLLSASEGQTKKPAPPPKVIKPLEIPKGAVETEPGTFRHTDAAGKKWVYRKTPFGVSRMEEKGAGAAAEPAKPAAADSYQNVRAFEEGDSIRFERPGPFGVSQWKTKKSDLNASERAVWTREKTRAAESKKD
jgi:hypothetical protein